MKAAIIQSAFLPWRGYFDIIQEVDCFVLLDDVQYTKRDWRSRNRIKTHNGSMWITVPVRAKADQAIDEVLVDYEQDWTGRMLKTLRQAYARAPYGDEVLKDLESVLSGRFEYLSGLNQALLRWVCSRLQIETEIVRSRPLEAKGVKDDRLIGILKRIGATQYLSGPAAKDYIDEQKFAAAGIELEYKDYNYAPYDQLHPPYDPYVSVIDLLMMTGPCARDFVAPVREEEAPDAKAAPPSPSFESHNTAESRSYDEAASNGLQYERI